MRGLLAVPSYILHIFHRFSISYLDHSQSQRYLATFRGKDVAGFIKERKKEGVSGNTIRLDLALISKLFKVAASDWGMESLVNPVEHVSKPKISAGRKRRLENNEEDKLLDACTTIFRPVVLFALETAMRRSEIAALNWKYVNLEKRYAHLPKTKNQEARTVPLSPAAIKILKSLPKDIKGSVFRMTSGAITQAMRKACKKAQIENLHFHDLRHEAISRLFENTDLDAMEIKTISGHKTFRPPDLGRFYYDTNS